jgi:hypothetical protein
VNFAYIATPFRFPLHPAKALTMILVIDNYDSNLVHYLMELGALMLTAGATGVDRNIFIW